jgi:metal-responsive CopG/Arc/MetJ family transcriptional regulator
METIQVVLDAELLRAADRAAKQAKVNRSVLVRRALREHLRCLKKHELEARDRRGYQQWPDDPADAADWERVAAWPER